MTLLRARWLLLGIAAAVLVGHTLVFDFVTDDAYISFVFARNFAEHGQLAFNLGQPVEGYTNFLWTVILGAGMVIGIDPEISSLVLGIACGLGTLWLAFRIVERALGRPSLWACVPPLLLACSSGFACWTAGGLETQLFTVLVTAALEAFVAGSGAEGQRGVPDGRGSAPAGSGAEGRRGVIDGRGSAPAGSGAEGRRGVPDGRGSAPAGSGAEGRRGVIDAPRALRRMAICVALAAMTRPEGVLIAAVLGAALYLQLALARRWLPGRAEVIAAAWFLGLWGPWFLWRWHYYGYPFPNTYYVKASGPWASPGMASEMRWNGVYYVWAWLWQTKLVVALPVVLVGLAAARPSKVPARFALTSASALLLVIYLAYVISVGGDFMGLHRFIMPLFVIAALAVALGLEWLVALLPNTNRVIAGAAAAVVVTGAFAASQILLTRESLRPTNLNNDHGIDTPAFLILYTADRAAIGRAMAPCFHDDDFSIVGGAGAQPYFGHMRAIDAFGLVSEKIAHDEPRIRARAGHTKFASQSLLASLDPTFVFSCYALHASPTVPPMNQWQAPCDAAGWTRAGYEELTMRIPGARQFGEYYTFFAKKTRAFACPGVTRGAP